jgi:hypothetical protein
LLDGCLEGGKLPLDCDPDKREVDTEVIVRQPVAHSRDAALWDVRPALLRVLGEVLDCLADDFQLSDKRVLAHPVGHERIPAGSGVLLDILNGFENVPR